MSEPRDLTDYPEALAAADWLRARFGIPGAVAGVQLGSGWGAVAPAWGEPGAEVPFAAVPGFRTPAAPGHDGLIRHYRWDGSDVIVLAGRTHLYEGHGPAAVVHGVRTLAALGVERLCLTNAAGTVHADWPLGQVVVLTDHLNATGVSPLVGARFVDLSQVYDPGLRKAALLALPDAREGVYAMFSGPNYETPAEVRAAARLGADLTGMSTALEAIAAAEFAIRVVALSIVTAHSASGERIEGAEVVRVAASAAVGCAPAIRRVLA